jgi:hypothetical protein
MNARAALLGLALALATVPAIAGAKPSPHPSGALLHKVPRTFANPAAGAKVHSMNGRGCIAVHPNAEQTEVNPVTGKLRAAPVVSIPVTAHSGSVASATARAQQAHACAHSRN